MSGKSQIGKERIGENGGLFDAVDVEGGEILRKVSAAMLQTFRIPSDRSIGPETSSADVEGWDSLSHAILIMKIEEAFGIELPFDRIYGLNNVGQLVQLVQEITGARA
jgi:acyl carrier protein